jgi:hypothetical protein
MLSIDRPENFTRVLSGFYNRSWLSWAPEVLEATLIKNFQYNPREVEVDKIEAVRELLRGDKSFSDIRLFENVVLALNDEPVDFEVWQGVEPKQMALGIYLMKRLSGRHTFGRSVRAYIAATLFYHDIHLAPAALHLDEGAAFLTALTGAEEAKIEAVTKHLPTVLSLKTDTAIAHAIEAIPEDDEANFVRRQLAMLSEIALYLNSRGADE